jgi:uncharacterized protein YeeX (DUF496 family)
VVLGSLRALRIFSQSSARDAVFIAATMTYRDDNDALHARKEALEHDLDAAKKKLAESDDLAFRAARMERELIEVEARLRGEKKRLPMLDNLRVASPCNASWDEMKGDERVRFCSHCEKNVFNLSAMTRDEAEALILATNAKICVRMYRRADGTMLTEDCPEGLRKKRRKRLAAALVGGAAVAAAASFASARQGARVVQGEPMIMPSSQVLPVSATPSITPPATPPVEHPVSPEMGQMMMGEPAMPEQPQPPSVPAHPRRVRR